MCTIQGSEICRAEMNALSLKFKMSTKVCINIEKELSDIFQSLQKKDDQDLDDYYKENLDSSKRELIYFNSAPLNEKSYRLFSSEVFKIIAERILNEKSLRENKKCSTKVWFILGKISNWINNHTKLTKIAALVMGLCLFYLIFKS